eukprot:6380943-Pyramimonas_sp.AAC.1
MAPSSSETLPSSGPRRPSGARSGPQERGRRIGVDPRKLSAMREPLLRGASGIKRWGGVRLHASRPAREPHFI